MSALLVGVMFGLSAGFAPGPLLTLVVTQTLHYSVREGIRVAMAPLITDVPIILISFFILNRLATFDMALGFIAVSGGMYVLYLSYETIKTRPARIETSPSQPRSLGKGALVNALNPHPYLFWVSVGVPFILRVQQSDPKAVWAFIFSFYCFLIGSKVVTALIVGKFRTFLEGKIYLYIMRFLGIILAVFAISLFRNALVYFGLI